MVNYACTFNQSELGKYFETIIIIAYHSKPLVIIIAKKGNINLFNVNDRTMN